MTPLAKDIVTFLENKEYENTELVFKTNLFIAKEPSIPVNVVTIYDVPGYPNDITLTNEKVYRSSFQVRIRNTSYTNGMLLAHALRDALDLQAHIDINGTRYELIRAVSEPIPLNWDENQNIIIVTNFETLRR